MSVRSPEEILQTLRQCNLHQILQELKEMTKKGWGTSLCEIDSFLQRAYHQPKHPERSKCERCEGKGTVPDKYPGDDFKCPDCNGTGFQ